MNEHIPHLNIETLENGNLRLENESMGDTYVVDVHPIHVRLLAERIGLIAPVEADPDKRTLAEMARDIDRLKRNTLRLREHGLQLQRKFANDADWEHADLTFEMGLINTLVDLMDMAVDDFVDDFVGTSPEPIPRDTTGTKPSKNPAKTQSVPSQGQLEITA